jgi:hypothetical protein
MPSVLAVFKVLGLVLTAFFGIAEFFRNKAGTPDNERRRRTWGIAAILSSLALAAAAEILDAISKTHEATDAAKRAADSADQARHIIYDLDRSLHPLLPLEVTLIYSVRFNDPLFTAFRMRLMKAALKDDASRPILHWGNPFFPNPRDELAPYAALTAEIEAMMFVVRKPKDSVPLEREEPDLSVPLSGRSFSGHTAGADELIADDLDSVQFNYSKEGDVFINTSAHTVKASDCYFNGRIISMSDLLGSRMSVRIQAFTRFFGDNLNKDLMDQAVMRAEYEPMNIFLSSPGRREIEIRRGQMKVQDAAKGRWFSFTFPTSLDAMEKLLVP